MPLVNIKVSPLTLHMQFATLTASNLDVDGINASINDIEIQGSNTVGNGHTHIVWIDRWQRISLLDIRRRRRTRHQQPEAYSQKPKTPH